MHMAKKLAPTQAISSRQLMRSLLAHLQEPSRVLRDGALACVD
jgi:hypothetical protein